MIEKPTGRESLSGEFPDAKWREGLPTLVEYLTQVKWSDGSDRDVSTVTIKHQDGLVLAVCNDVAMRRGLYVTGETVEKALKALERALGQPGADWRAWGGSSKRRK